MKAINQNMSTPFYQCQTATVSLSEVTYPQASLLGLPWEIREQIWQAISDDIRQPDGAWFERLGIEFEGLLIVCRQIWHETSNHWPRAIAPSNRLSKFLFQPPGATKVSQLRAISLEVPFNMTLAFYSRLSDIIRVLNPFLEDLRLFFTGNNLHERSASRYVCVNDFFDRHIPSSMLPVDILVFKCRMPLIQAIGRLENLHTLVIRNFNIPFLQAHLIRYKPKLTRLCVLQDPRVSLQWPYNANNAGMFLTPVIDYFSPVKELQISTNAVRGAAQLTSKLASTLEDLTWIMPDMSQETGIADGSQFAHSGVVLFNLRYHAPTLHTLRLCIENVISDEVFAPSQFISEFKLNVPLFHGLKNLDLHICSKTPRFGPEIIQALPTSIERLYISDKLIEMEDFLLMLNGIYLQYEYILSERMLWFHVKPENLINIGFIGYDYTPDTDPILAEEHKMEILRVNGKLLDRELNRHLKFEDGDGGTMEFRERYELIHSVNTSETALQKMYTGRQRDYIAHVMVRCPKFASSRMCQSLRDDFYLLSESEAKIEAGAKRAFDSEEVAKVSERPIRHYPMEIDAGLSDHWNC